MINNVRIDQAARLVHQDLIRIGPGTRIDAFALITAGPETVTIGKRVHVGAGVQVFGAAGVTIGNFVNLSGRVSVYSTSDDFVGGWLAGPMIPDEYRNVQTARVNIEPHALIGAGAVILPGVTLGEGCAIGALSLVKEDVAAGDVVGGIPARRIGKRDIERIRALEQRLGPIENSAREM